MWEKQSPLLDANSDANKRKDNRMPETKPRFSTGSQVKPIPDGFHSVTPYLCVKGAAKAIDFYKKALGAQERYRMEGPDGKTVAHAEIVIGNSIVMLSDEMPGQGNQSPVTLKATPVSFVIYVQDADAVFKRAVDAGAAVTMPIADQFFGDRAGSVQDPFGHKWMIMTHIEDVSPEEMKKRMAAQSAKMSQNN
jgi:PhnB protein